MNKVDRLSVVYLLAAIAAGVAISDWAVAQRIRLGGQGQGNQSNRDDDDDDQDAGQSGNQQGNSGVQQFLQGGQGGASQRRIGGQQGQGQQVQGGQGQFPQQFQNLQQGNQGGLRFGTWQAGKWQGSHKIDNLMQAFGGGQQPFSAQWYQDHPKAWKYDNQNANVWVVASLPGVYSWLGWGNVPPQYNVDYGHARHFDPSHYGDWYPLGVFSLMAGPGDVGTRIVQLVVDRHGHVAGNYYDMISNSAYNVSGDVRRQSQHVQFSLNKNKFITFRAPIHELLRPYGTMSVQLPGGEQPWQFVRLED